MGEKNTREYGLDLLKIIAFLCVANLHILADAWYELPADTMPWQMINAMRNTWCVPVFVMISGRFILDPNKPMPAAKIRRYFFRAVKAFAVFSVLYKGLDFVRQGMDPAWFADWKWQLTDLVDGEYHLWYLVMLVGLYLITPLLRKITEDRKLTEQFLILFFSFECLRQYGVHIPKVGILLQPILDNMGFHFALGYSGYFVLGYYLAQRSFSPRQERMIYVAGLICLIAGYAGNSIYTLASGEKSAMFTEPLTPNLIVVSTAVFVFFAHRVNRTCLSERMVSWIFKLEPYCFGAYLIHVFFVNIAIDYFPIAGGVVHPVLAALVQTSLVAWASLLCCWLWKNLCCQGKKS